MDRKQFLKTGIAGVVGLSLAKNVLAASEKSAPLHVLTNQIGFNHLPNMEIKTDNTVLHRANTRGHANHGWLKTWHSFSFANYYNPERIHFGALRVLNDDIIDPGRGFGTHPHKDMEIITIPLEGDLAHKDSMGNSSVIRHGEIQVMSAGTGVQHSEFNSNNDSLVKLFQIWVFPRQQNLTPRYGQLKIDYSKADNAFLQILSPSPDDEGVWIHQDAWFNIANMDEGLSLDYSLHLKTNGVYALVIEGSADISGNSLDTRDALGIWDVDQVTVTATSKSRVLLLEVPMAL